MVVIDTNIDGVILEEFVSLDGSHHAAFRFENVTVPSHHIIGEPGRAYQSHSAKSAIRVCYSPLRPAATMRWTLNYSKHT